MSSNSESKEFEIIKSYGSTDSQDIIGSRDEGDDEEMQMEVDTPFLLTTSSSSNSLSRTPERRAQWNSNVEPLSIGESTPDRRPNIIQQQLNQDRDGVNWNKLWKAMHTICHCGFLVTSIFVCWFLLMLTIMINDSGKVSSLAQVSIVLIVMTFGMFLVYVSGRLLLNDCFDEGIVNKLCFGVAIVVASFIVLNFITLVLF